MPINLSTWQRDKAKGILTRVGIKKGQNILDFGCGEGIYTIPVAQIAGEKGLVYALDESEEDLSRLMEKARMAGLKNIVKLACQGKFIIPLESETIDVALLFDVLHYYYFPQKEDRQQLLKETYRVLKPGGILSVYPTHLELDQVPDINAIKAEIGEANFFKTGEYPELLMAHEGNVEKGRIINFKR